MSMARKGRLFAALAATLLASAAWAQDYDVLIRGGTVYDGTGSKGQKLDVAIKGNRIAKVGDIPASATATKVVDASGKIVAPGFIDPHSHTVDGLAAPETASAGAPLFQGITTVMINPDGGGGSDLAKQLAPVRANVPGVNVLPMIGHNGVRREVMDLANRKATPAELEKMKALVDKAMKEDGSFSLSTGPFYIPGKFSDTHELVELAKVAAKYPGAFYISHVRDESSYDIGVVNAIKELIEVSRQAKLPGIVTHMKMLGPTVWGKSVEAVATINAARAEGLSIWADQYPYAASGSGLQPSLVPGWAQEGGPDAIAKRLQNPEQRALIRKEMIENMSRRGGANAIMISKYDPDPSRQGKRLDELARAQLKEPVDVAIEMLIQGGAGIYSFNMNEKDVEEIMRQTWAITSTDGGLPKFGEGMPHPRTYGAFPRKIRRYVLDKPVITMEHAIRSSSGLPAEVFGIKDRGFVKPGYYADVVVFNPATIRDVATYEKPHAYSEGMEFVFVNGQAAIADGKLTPERHGVILDRSKQ